MDDSRKSRFNEHLQTSVAACLRRHVSPDQRIAIGLSGGVDSVVLLHALRRLHGPLTAIHVDHGLSGNAGRWSDFCRMLCSEWGIPLRIERVGVDRRSADGLEAAARRARHAAFCSEESAWIALGHHRGDRVETILFNMLRGAGVRGVGAMPERSGRLLRPLLAVSRKEILEYAARHQLSWVDDESNADVRHSRNFLRHRIIPVIEQRFPTAEERLASAASRFEEAAGLLDELARLDLSGHPQEFPVPVSLLAALPEPRARNVLRFLLAAHGVGVPSEERLVEALRQFVNARPDSRPGLAFGHARLSRRRGFVVLE